MRLRPLTEAECYARCYGGHATSRSAVVRVLPRPTRGDARARREPARALRASGSTSAGRRRRPHDARLPHLDLAPPARRVTPRRPAGAAASELVGLHGDVDAASCHAVKPRGRQPPSCRPRRPRARARLRLLRDQPGPRLGRRGRALREPAQRLLAAPPRRRLHAAAASSRRSSSSCSSSATASRTPRTGRRPGSGDLRRGDFDARRLETHRRASCGRARSRSSARRPTAALFGERPELGPQLRTLGPHRPLRPPVDLARERRRAVRRAAALVRGAARRGSSRSPREAVRALVVDADERVLLVQFRNPVGERDVVGHARRRRRAGRDRRGGAPPRAARGDRACTSSSSARSSASTRATFPWARRLLPPAQRVYLVRVDAHEPAPTIDLDAGGRRRPRWWTLDELARVAASEFAAAATSPERGA